MNCEHPHIAAITGYTEGCRCDRCKAAGTAYHREYRQRNRKRVQETRNELRRFKKLNCLMQKKD